jgi:signal transduction histidine kinase
VVEPIRQRAAISPVQQRIGYLIGAFGLLAFLDNLYTGIVVNQRSFIDEFATIYSFPVLLLAVLCLLTAWVNGWWARAVQCFLFVAVGTISLLQAPTGGYGIGFFIISIALLFQYGFFRTRPILKIAVVLVNFFSLSAYFGFALEATRTGSITEGLNNIIYFAFVLVIIWLIFSEQIGAYIRRNKKLEDDAVRVRPFVDIGQNVGGLVHNLRNDILLINNSLYFLQKNEDSSKETLDDLQRSVRQLSGRIDRIMFITREKNEAELLDVNELIRAVSELFLCVSDFKKQVKLELDLHDSLFLFGEKSELRQVMENLIKNSWEAISGTGKYGTLTIRSRRADGAIEIVVEDTGKGIPACADCTRGDCMECGNFAVGKSSKPGGSGYGIVYVRKTVKKYRGSLRVEIGGESPTKIIIQLRETEHEEKSGDNRRFGTVQDANGAVVSV